MALSPGTQLGPYLIEEMLGVGGMGEVYRATDTHLKRAIAIKVLPASLARDPERLARFQREAEVLAALNHANIAQIYGLEKSDRITALVLELVEGPTVAELVSRGPLPIEEARRIGAQIANAVEAAHDRGIIHRDLKPANIKLTALGEAKVLDFGLAKVADAWPASPETGLTVTGPPLMTAVGVIVGTCAYMSPEQANGLPLDRRSDIWAFGCVLYELLAGRRAFSGESFAQVTSAVLQGAVDWSLIPSTTPPTILALLRRCLERNPRQRLRDIGEARIVLEQPDVAWRIDAGLSTASPYRRWPWAVALGLVLALVIAVAISQRTSWVTQPLSHRVMQFTMPVTPAEHLPATAAFRRPNERAVTISRDGQVVVFAGERVTGKDSQKMLYRRPIGDPVSSPIAGTDGADAGFLSPDGSWVAFISPGGTLRKVQLAGGTPEDICIVNLDAFGGGIVGASWGDDGTIVLGSQAGPLRQVFAKGGIPSDITSFAADTNDYTHRLPHHLPEGRGVIYTSIADPVGDPGRVYVLPRGGGPPKLLLENAADARYLRSGHLAFMRSGVLMDVPFDLQRLAISGTEQPVVHDVMQSLGSDNPYWNSRTGQFDLSDTGTLVYASGGVFPPIINRLLWLYRDGRTEPIGEPGRSLLGPRISPDGKEIVVGQMRDPKQPLRLYDFRRQLWTSWADVNGHVAFPVWTPDAQQVVFNWYSQGRGGIHIARLDGSGVRQLTSGPRPRVPSDISRDGLLAFVENFTPTRADIWVMPLDGSVPPKLVIHNSGDDWQPVFAPDGRWLAYSSDVSGTLEVYLEAFPGPGRRIQVSSGGGTGAIWSRDGRTLYYIKTTRTEHTLMEVPIQTAPILSAGTPRVVTKFPYLVSGPARSYDVTPDHQRFVVTTYEYPGGAPVTELHVIVNWPERLKN
jgi:eukaryotic-like serine/threonine-protein kinase